MLRSEFGGGGGGGGCTATNGSNKFAFYTILGCRQVSEVFLLSM